MQHQTATVGSVVGDTSHNRLLELDDFGQIAEYIHQRLDRGNEQAGLVSDRFDLYRSQLTQLIYSPWQDPKPASQLSLVKAPGILRQITPGKNLMISAAARCQPMSATLSPFAVGGGACTSHV